MLHLLTDYAYCFLWADRALLVKYRAWYQPKVLDKAWVYAENEALLLKLGELLKQPKWQCRTKVVLCGNLVKYRLIMHDSRLTEAEHLALAKHQFGQLYGKSLTSWQVFLQKMRFEKNNLAVAVDEALFQKIQHVFKSFGIKISQMRPCLVEWLNTIRKQVCRDGWAILVNEQEVYILRIQNREMIKINHHKSNTLTEVEIIQMLTRMGMELGEQIDARLVLKFHIIDGWPRLISSKPSGLIQHQSA